MENDELFKNLKSLRPAEVIAKKYYEKHHLEMDYSQYFYLYKRNFPNNSLELLETPSAHAEIHEFKKHFNEIYKRKTLSEKDFITPEQNIEIDQLLRYIHIPEHTHDFIEISCILEGFCTHIIGGKSYVQQIGSITYIPSHTNHELFASPDCVCLTIKIRNTAFLSYQLPNMPYYSVPISFYCEDDTFVRNIIIYMYMQQRQKNVYYDTLIEYLFQSLITYCMQKYSDTMELLVVNNSYNRLQLDIINYMYENFQTITLHSMAKALHYSEAYLSHLIHQSTGETFSTIIRNFKLQQAATLLQESNMKLNDICDAIGYKDTTQFIRNFKNKYGTTPAKYRKIYQQ